MCEAAEAIACWQGLLQTTHLQEIDKALPRKNTVKIYNALNRTAAAILVQLRTNISIFITYLRRTNIADTDRCEYRITETLPHFLFAWSRWKNERQAMRAARGNKYWDLSYALGEQSTPERDLKKVDGERHKWQSDMNTVKAIVESARVTGRPQKQPWRHADQKSTTDWHKVFIIQLQ
jgi:hypothetical protein